MRRGLFAALALLLGAACGGAQHPQRTVSLRMAGTPPGATVTIDDIRLGALGYVAKRGVALPPGQHRVTVEADGYFPWDRLVDAKDEPVTLQVELTKIPE